MLILNIYTFVLIVVFFLFLIVRRENPLPNKLLAFIILSPAFNFLSNIAVLSEKLPSASLVIIFYFSFVTAFFFAPLTYTYIEILCGRKLSAKNPLFYFTGASILIVIYSGMQIYSSITNEDIDITAKLQEEPFYTQMMFINSIFIMLQQIYFTLSLLRVYRFKKTIPHVLSSNEAVRIQFTERFIVLIWMLNLTVILAYILLPMYMVEYIIHPFLLMIVYGFIVFFGLKYNGIFNYKTCFSFQEIVSSVTCFETTDKEAVPKADQELANRIKEHIRQTNAYLNPEYTLYDLSKALHIPSSKISYAINHHLNMSFSDLVNDYRVENAKEILLKNNHLSIEGIALSTGFNSRSTFYRVFKKHTDLTPSEFAKNTTNQRNTIT